MPFSDPKSIAPYFRERNSRRVSFYMAKKEQKDRLKAVADADNLDVVSWLEHFVMPYVIRLIEQKEIEHRLMHSPPPSPATRRGRNKPLS